MALWNEGLPKHTSTTKPVKSQGIRIATMWTATALWVIVGSSIPRIAHNLSIMIGVTLLMIGPTCCAQISWTINSQINRVRVANDRYIGATINPDVYFQAGRLYERQNVDPAALATRLHPNVVYLKRTKGVQPAGVANGRTTDMNPPETDSALL